MLDIFFLVHSGDQAERVFRVSRIERKEIEKKREREREKRKRKA